LQLELIHTSFILDFECLLHFLAFTIATFRCRIHSTPYKLKRCRQFSFPHRQNTYAAAAIQSPNFITPLLVMRQLKRTPQVKANRRVSRRERELSGNGNAVISSFAVIEISVRSENKHPGKGKLSVLVVGRFGVWIRSMDKINSAERSHLLANSPQCYLKQFIFPVLNAWTLWK
jgi:hypothetical protein